MSHYTGGSRELTQYITVTDNRTLSSLSISISTPPPPHSYLQPLLLRYTHGTYVSVTGYFDSVLLEASNVHLVLVLSALRRPAQSLHHLLATLLHPNNGPVPGERVRRERRREKEGDNETHDTIIFYYI